MRDALSLTDQAIAFGSGVLEEATVRQMLGSVDPVSYTHLDVYKRQVLRATHDDDQAGGGGGRLG